ncbi:hypothetical protein LTR62_003217 [Meristemomyces frigidus]|uniref:Uncharacterized protein n=1 Tax=Meristemomyces frigidus TaxID=1508187 RepID=A0AAN7YH93_9PEZI|nr:hypothetical protein LTR62_003217 [Meristemomyces frigidus]
MVASDFTVTVSSGGLLVSKKPSKRGPRKKKQRIEDLGSTTPFTSTRASSEDFDLFTATGDNSPAATASSSGAAAYDASRRKLTLGDTSGTPYFEAVGERGVLATPGETSGLPSGSLPPAPERPATLTSRQESLETNDGNAIETIEQPAVTITQPRDEKEENAIILDPANSDRQYVEDPYTALKREVWRPGDGDSKQGLDSADRQGRPLPLEQRWRFYQSRPRDAAVSAANMPPKFVILDDRAAYEVLSSDISRVKLSKFWSFDFVGSGKMRNRRPHRGRAAIANPAAVDNARYHFGTTAGLSQQNYYFTGQKDYIPIIYRLPNCEASTTNPESASVEANNKRQATSPPVDSPLGKKKGPHHNQYTAKELMVKNGAPSDAPGRKRYRPRINAFLRRDPSPEWAKDRSKLYGNIGELARVGAAEGLGAGRVSKMTANEGGRAASVGLDDACGNGAMMGDDGDESESMWVEQDDSESMWMEQDDANGASPEPRICVPGGFTDDLDDQADTNATPPTDEAAVLATKATLSRRKQLPQPMSFIDQLAATPSLPQTEPQPTNIRSPSAHDSCLGSQSKDNGRYPIELELRLGEVNEEMQGLRNQLSAAQGRILRLEAEVEDGVFWFRGR